MKERCRVYLKDRFKCGIDTQSIEKLILTLVIVFMIIWLAVLTINQDKMKKDQDAFLATAEEVSEHICFVDINRYGD